METLVHWLWIFPALAQTALIGRIVQSGSARRRPILLALAVSTVLIMVGFTFLQASLSGRLYFKVWIAAYVLTWGLTALALAETCTLSLQAYPRFGRVGARIIQAVLVTTGLIIAGWLFFAPPSWPTRFSSFLQAQGHLVTASLALLGASVLVFSWWARLKLHGNGSLVVRGITIFCAGEALMASGIGAALSSWAYLIGVAWSTACWLTIALRWNAAEEAAPAPKPFYDQAASAAGRLTNLESTNDRLADILRRG